DEMLGKLNIELNRARQQAITMEITEIVGALEALT
ncbi:MAG: F0F1 ATP synthase subunit gamma, partial [Christensenella sp.]